MRTRCEIAAPEGTGLASAFALAVVYFAVAGTSIHSFGTNTPLWFANAIAVAWLLPVRGGSLGIAVALIALADTLAVTLFSGGAAPPPLVALADLTEVMLVLLLLRRMGGADSALSSVPGVIRLILICLTVPIISACYGAAVLNWFEAAPLLDGFVTWYFASALGLLLVLPSGLTWRTAALRRQLDNRSTAELVLLAIGLATLALFVFDLDRAAFLFVTFPALLLLVWSSGLIGASVGSAVLLVIGVWRTLSGDSAIAVLTHPFTGMHEQILALQIYLAAVTLSSLPLAVVLGAQQRLSAELARVAHARSDFLAAMSHEIRTPMTGVLGIVDLLEAEDLTPKQRSYLGSIRASGRHLLNIINDILDFSRLETGKIDLEQVDFSVPMLLERARSLLDPLATERGIALRVELAEDSPPVVKGDPTRLKQVLLNLAGNAIKFTPEGSVTVAVSFTRLQEGRYSFRFEVRDTGIGIPLEKQADLFSAFTQGDSSTKRQFGGSGLGLAISRRLVHAMGGEIHLESAPGAGSLFWFEVRLEQGDALRLPQAEVGTERAALPRRVLLAEDVELNRDIVMTMLEREGHEVVVATNGHEAFQQVRQSQFDVVLMDVHMPVVDGLEATRLIRKLPPPNGNVPIVALTANVMASEQEKCIKAGMDGVLMKPIDWERVRDVLHRCERAAEERDDVQADAATRVNTELDATSGQSPHFSEAAFGQIAKMLPQSRLAVHVEGLESNVSALSDALSAAESNTVAELAHKIVSQAGMLGLQRLSAAAAQVEESAHCGVGLHDAVANFQAAASDVRIHVQPRLGRADRQPPTAAPN